MDGVVPRAARARRRSPPPSRCPAATTPAASPVADAALLQAVQAATSLVKAHRMHGHLAARLDPLGSAPIGDPALDPATVNLTDALMRRIPASVLRVAVPGETFADALPRLREIYTRHDRLRDRAHLRARAARMAAPGDRVGHLPPAARRRGEALPAAAPVRGGGARELPAQGLPREEAVLDRGPRLDRADARPDDRAGRRGVARARSCSAWPTAAASTCWPTTSGARTSRSSWSSRASRRCPTRRPSPRAAPAT